MERLKRDIDKQELKNTILERGNIGLIKGKFFCVWREIENRQLKEQVGEKAIEIQRKEAEASVRGEIANKTEEQLRREILEFKKVDNPFNTTMGAMNMTAMMGNTPFENSVLGSSGVST